MVKSLATHQRTSITRKLIRNTEFQAPAQTYWNCILMRKPAIPLNVKNWGAMGSMIGKFGGCVMAKTAIKWALKKCLLSIPRKVPRIPFLFSFFVFRAQELSLLTDFGVRQTQDRILVLPLVSCMALRKFLNLSEMKMMIPLSLKDAVRSKW